MSKYIDPEKLKIELAGILQNEFIRQVDLIQCDNDDLRSWIVHEIKKKILTPNVTFEERDCWTTGGSILLDAALDGDLGNNFVFNISTIETEIFKEAEKLIDNEIRRLQRGVEIKQKN